MLQSPLLMLFRVLDSGVGEELGGGWPSQFFQNLNLRFSHIKSCQCLLYTDTFTFGTRAEQSSLSVLLTVAFLFSFLSTNTSHENFRVAAILFPCLRAVVLNPWVTTLWGVK